MIKKLCLFFFSCITAWSYANSLPSNVPVNGGLAIIPIEIESKPQIYYDNNPVTVVASGKKNIWLVLVGIALDKKDPIQELNMVAPMKGSIPFHINQKNYKTQHITITNRRKVTPNHQDQKRIAAEKLRMAEIVDQWQESNPYQQRFIAPVKGRISSQFGLKRIYNKKPRNPHTGLDIAAPAGTPIKATAKGKVIATGDYFFTGNTVFVEHGQGVISLYAHMQKIDVKPGQQVKQGEVLGTVGKTGRATGPHLHWSMIVNQTLVDPLLFVNVNDIKPTPEKKKTKKAIPRKETVEKSNQ